MNRNGISSLGDNGICIPLSTSSYDFSESERYDEQYNERQEKQPMDNTYTYRAKRKDWQEWVKSCQYVTGNMVTLGDRYFLVTPAYGGDELYIDDFTEIDKDTIEPVINPVIDKKKEVLSKEEILIKVHSELTNLSDSTTDKELAALCDACNYDYDTLSEWNKECKLQARGSIISSNFARALAESYYDDNALIDYAKKYKEFMNEPPVKTNNIKTKISDRVISDREL